MEQLENYLRHIIKALRCSLVMLFFILLHSSVRAQSGSLDNSFNPNDKGFGSGKGISLGAVHSVALQQDGKCIIGGDFKQFDLYIRNRIVRLNSDGSYDKTFNVGTGANAYVNAIAIQSDGKIIIGGNFTDYNGTATNRIARLNADGTIDATFNVGTGLNGYVETIVIQSDGKIIIGGSFSSYNGTAVKRIVRLNVNGTIDATFRVDIGVNSTISSIAIQNDGKIIIGGVFTNYNGLSMNRIARLNSDGTLDTSFNIGVGATDFVNSVALQNDGKILVAGHFLSFNGRAMNRIVRLNNDGSIDFSFYAGNGADKAIYKIAQQTDGKIIIGGELTKYDNTTTNNLARLNEDGSLDEVFNQGSNNLDVARDFAIQSDGKIVLGGFDYIERFNIDGTMDHTFNEKTGVEGSVNTVVLQNDNKIIIGGSLEYYNGIRRFGIARIYSDGLLDETFNTELGYTNIVSDLKLLSNGKILIGGSFGSFGGKTTKNIALLNTDGTIDPTFNNTYTGANSSVYAIAVQSDGKIIIGGNFTTYNGLSKNRIARLNIDGTYDATFNIGTGANSTVTSLAIQEDGKIIIAGNFTNYNGTAINRIARLNIDGTIDATFNVGVGLDNSADAIVIQEDGKIIISGYFTTYNGLTKNRIAKINNDGSIDDTFNIGTGANNYIEAISVQNDGKIIIGGIFTSFNETTMNRFARLESDGALDPTFNIGSGTYSGIRSIVIQDDGKILIGGGFTSYNGIGRNYIARILSEDTAIELPLIKSSNHGFYPNPTTGCLFFDSNYVGKYYALYNLSGILIKEGTIEDLRIDISELSPSVYLLQIDNTTFKVVKK